MLAFATVLLLLSSGLKAAGQTLPACGAPCAVSAAQQSGCSYSNLQCMCRSPTFLPDAYRCIRTACDNQQQNRVEILLSNMCGVGQVPALPSNPTPPAPQPPNPPRPTPPRPTPPAPNPPAPNPPAPNPPAPNPPAPNPPSPNPPHNPPSPNPNPPSPNPPNNPPSTNPPSTNPPSSPDSGADAQPGGSTPRPASIAPVPQNAVTDTPTLTTRTSIGPSSTVIVIETVMLPGTGGASKAHVPSFALLTCFGLMTLYASL